MPVLWTGEPTSNRFAYRGLHCDRSKPASRIRRAAISSASDQPFRQPQRVRRLLAIAVLTVLYTDILRAAFHIRTGPRGVLYPGHYGRSGGNRLEWLRNLSARSPSSRMAIVASYSSATMRSVCSGKTAPFMHTATTACIRVGRLARG